MSILRFEPIATQLAKQTSPARLFPADALDAIRHNTILQQTDPAWAPVVLDFMSHYAAVIEIAHLLLGAPPFERLARLYDALKKDYTPEQQVSPVYDSHLVQHVLGGVPQGVAGETPFSVLARLAHGDDARARVREMAQTLAGAHLDLYRVTRVAELEGEMLPLRGGEPITAHLTGPFLREGDSVLARVVPFVGKHFLADSPYLLDASDGEWLAYVERAAEQAHAASSSSAGQAPRAKPKLTSKQAARRRKELKAKAERNTPNERIVRHLRVGESERYWLDYVMAACSGARNGIVRLAGVPDQLETLPQHREYEPPELRVSDENEDENSESREEER